MDISEKERIRQYSDQDLIKAIAGLAGGRPRSSSSNSNIQGDSQVSTGDGHGLEQFICQYCKKEFRRESTLSSHLCEPKRRHNEKNETGVRLGFAAWLRFRELTQGNAKNNAFSDFAASNLYKAFVKFGRYMVDIRAVNPSKFTDWVLKQNKKIDHWCRDSVYTEYLINHVRCEDPSDALTRAIQFSIEWGEKNQSPPEHCLLYGNDNLLLQAVMSGRITAWAIYNSRSGQEFLERLRGDQLELIWPYIDSDYWMPRFKNYPNEQQWAQDMLEKAGW